MDGAGLPSEVRRGRVGNPPRVLIDAPPHLRADRLWRQLAKAQDAALQRDPLPAPRVPGRARLRKRPIGVALVALGAAAALVTLLAHRAPPRTSISTSTPPGEVDRQLVADAHSDLPLRFPTDPA